MSWLCVFVRKSRMLMNFVGSLLLECMHDQIFKTLILSLLGRKGLRLFHDIVITFVLATDQS